MGKKIQKILAMMAAVILISWILKGIVLEDTAQNSIALAEEEYISINVKGEIRSISFQDYVCAVTAKQIPLDSPYEALKAQLVITRTNLRKFQEDYPGTLLSEEFVNPEELEEKGSMDLLRRAEKETKNQVLTFENHLVQVPFHRVSSGRTRSGKRAGLGEDYDWLTGVSSRQDIESEWYLAVELADEKQIRESIAFEYPTAFSEAPILEQIEIIKRDKSDYVTRIAVGKQQISGEKFRSLLGLSSSCFYLEEAEGKIRITTKGVGHGLGLSQYGARRMAEEGKTYQEILLFYFKKLVMVQ